MGKRKKIMAFLLIFVLAGMLFSRLEAGPATNFLKEKARDINDTIWSGWKPWAEKSYFYARVYNTRRTQEYPNSRWAWSQGEHHFRNNYYALSWYITQDITKANPERIGLEFDIFHLPRTRYHAGMNYLYYQREFTRGRVGLRYRLGGRWFLRLAYALNQETQEYPDEDFYTAPARWIYAADKDRYYDDKSFWTAYRDAEGSTSYSSWYEYGPNPPGWERGYYYWRSRRPGDPESLDTEYSRDGRYRGYYLTDRQVFLVV